VATKREINDTRDELQVLMSRWREQQAIHMGSVKARILDQQPQPLEDEVLLLPSEFSEADRNRLGLSHMAEMEMELWQGQASECILRLRCLGKTMSAFEGLQRKEAIGQRGRTRTHTKLQVLEFLQERVLSLYSYSREALTSLGTRSTIDVRFPPLTVADLFRKSTQDKRVIGDTHRPDGGLYRLGGVQRASTTLDTHRPIAEGASTKLCI
jgi:hypothetical protein